MGHTKVVTCTVNTTKYTLLMWLCNCEMNNVNVLSPCMHSLKKIVQNVHPHVSPKLLIGIRWKFGTGEVYTKYCFVNLISVYSVLKKDTNN